MKILCLCRRFMGSRLSLNHSAYGFIIMSYDYVIEDIITLSFSCMLKSKDPHQSPLSLPCSQHNPPTAPPSTHKPTDPSYPNNPFPPMSRRPLLLPISLSTPFPLNPLPPCSLFHLSDTIMAFLSVRVSFKHHKMASVPNKDCFVLQEQSLTHRNYTGAYFMGCWESLALWVANTQAV